MSHRRRAPASRLTFPGDSAYYSHIAHRDPYGVPDWRYTETSRTRFNVLAGVGVFGAGLSYSTFYTAKPTEAQFSLTLMSWAYTAFLSCTLVSIVWQIVLTSGFPVSRGPAYRSRAGVWAAIATCAVSAYAGTVLLTLALTRHASRAISAAAYTIVGSSVVLVVSSAVRYYVTIRKTSRLTGRPAGFVRTMLHQQQPFIGHRDREPLPRPARKLMASAPPPTMTAPSPTPGSAPAVDPDDAAALFFLQADDAYGGALRYIKRRCPAWESIKVERQAELLMETIECFCVDSGAFWLNLEHGRSDFLEFVCQAPRWTAAVEDLRREPHQSYTLDFPESGVRHSSGPVRAHQVVRLTRIFEEVEGQGAGRNERDNGMQPPLE